MIGKRSEKSRDEGWARISRGVENWRIPVGLLFTRGARERVRVVSSEISYAVFFLDIACITRGKIAFVLIKRIKTSNFCNLIHFL